MKSFLLFFLSFWLYASDICAQQLPATKKQYLNFSFLTIKDGLSQGMINFMLQDHFGFMWFATKDGLNRYDGYKFVVYRNDPADSFSLGDNHVKSIFEDSKGRLWIGTSNGGLDLFDRETEKFFHFRNNAKDSNTISDNLVTHITEDRSGCIWISTGKGIDRIKCRRTGATANRYTYKSIITRINLDAQFSFVKQAAIQSKKVAVSPAVLFTDSKGITWVFSNNKGYYIRPTEDSFHISPYNLRHPAGSKTETDYNICSWAEDTVRSFIYLISNNTIFRIKGPGTAADFFDFTTYSRQVISVQSTVDENGLLWFTNLGFLVTVDFAANVYKDIYYAHNGKHVDAGCNIYRDYNGVMWIGTVGYGILRHLPQTAKFHFISHTSVSHLTESFPDILSIGGSELTNNFFDLNQGLFINRKSRLDNIPKRLEPFTYNSFLSYNGKHSLVLHGGLYWYDTERRKLQFLKSVGDQRCTLSDSSGMWVCSFDSLLYLNEKGKQLKSWAYPVTPANSPYSFCMMLLKDVRDNIWIASMKGLLYFNIATQQWKQYRHIENDTNSLSIDIVFSLCADPSQPEKYLWAGTEGGGLNRLDLQTGKIKCYREKDGLPNSVIYGIVPDGNGNLWMSTNKGLSCFNPKANTFLNYDDADGLQSNEFNRYAFGKSSSGWLYFGGINGFNYFKPEDVSTDTIFSKVIFTDFKINNKSASFGGEGDILPRPIYLTNTITLPYKYNMIGIDFASTNMSLPAKNFYQYKTDGFDENWILSGNTHSATYTNLDPGTYTFHVRASNYQNVWGSSEAILQITIVPPWYMTWWFRTLLLITIAGVLYALYRYRLNQALKLQAVRNRIASDLHDEIGSTLSSISIFSEVIDDRTKDTVPEVTPVIQRISESTSNMMDAMSDIVWAINPQNDRFENILTRMQAFAGEILEAKNCLLHLKVDDGVQHIKLGMETRKNFYLIFKETVNNTAKYAAAGNVWIHISLHNKHVHCTIKDDGEGFNMQQKKQGNGLFNIRKRARELHGTVEIISEKGKGTSVLLAFPVN